ncbi:hypothetical protein MUCCIDRAFT_108625 [Mucor lusitanicus CBS 277.49]|uniref:Uncharacterized protein n=1 Tax=Mucor lusitanicus CBS 277.49 TaxID=747725 RepID=A0A168ME46_MUCCL|nr:hypothetical protein MUCCIDRAFT_108625 [Mucor lusitanicus CBS 277.49]
MVGAMQSVDGSLKVSPRYKEANKPFAYNHRRPIMANTTKVLAIEEEHTLVAETLKRQLHIRILHSH